MQVNNCSLENNGTRFIAIASTTASLTVAVPPARIAAGPLRITQPPGLLCSSVWAKPSRQVGCQQSGQEGLLWLKRLLCYRLHYSSRPTARKPQTQLEVHIIQLLCPSDYQCLSCPSRLSSSDRAYFFLYRWGACLYLFRWATVIHTWQTS